MPSEECLASGQDVEQNSRFAAANFSPAQRHRKNLIDSRLKERFDSWVSIQKTYMFIQVANVASGPTWHFHNESHVQTLTRVFSDSSDFFCSLPVANSLALMWIWRASAKERMEHNTSKSKAQKPLDWAQTVASRYPWVDPFKPQARNIDDFMARDHRVLGFEQCSFLSFRGLQWKTLPEKQQELLFCENVCHSSP